MVSRMVSRMVSNIFRSISITKYFQGLRIDCPIFRCFLPTPSHDACEKMVQNHHRTDLENQTRSKELPNNLLIFIAQICNKTSDCHFKHVQTSHVWQQKHTHRPYPNSARNRESTSEAIEEALDSQKSSQAILRNPPIICEIFHILRS